MRLADTYDVQQKRFRVLCKNAPAMSASEIKKEYMAIKKELGTAFENAEEKVQLAGQTHDMVERQIKRIDAEIKKFQTDLEGCGNFDDPMFLDHSRACLGPMPGTTPHAVAYALL